MRSIGSQSQNGLAHSHSPILPGAESNTPIAEPSSRIAALFSLDGAPSASATTRRIVSYPPFSVKAALSNHPHQWMCFPGVVLSEEASDWLSHSIQEVKIRDSNDTPSAESRCSQSSFLSESDKIVIGEWLCCFAAVLKQAKARLQSELEMKELASYPDDGDPEVPEPAVIMKQLQASGFRDRATHVFQIQQINSSLRQLDQLSERLF